MSEPEAHGATPRRGIRAHLADTRPLTNPDYRRLWGANIVTVIGAQLSVVAVPAQIYVLTQSSAYVGLTGLFGLVPLVVFGLYGGVLADFLDRRKLLVVTTLGLIATSFAFFLQAALDIASVWLLLGLFALQQAFFAVNQPARAAIIPRLVPAEQLPAANALNATVVSFGGIAGPLAGGALIPLIGFSWLYLADSVSLLATLWAVLALPALPPLGAVARAGLRSVVDGFRYLLGHRILLVSFLVDIVAMIFGMPRALFPEIAHANFGGPLGGGLAFALLFAAIPAGSVVGGVFSGWVSRVERQGLAVLLSVVVWGVAVVGCGVAVALAGGSAGLFLSLAVLALVIGGAADMASMAFRSTMLQEAATDDVRGRLQGVFLVVVAGGPRLADVLHGGAASTFGAAGTVIGGGGLVIALVVVVAVLFPAFRHYSVRRPA